jgi:thioredoxin reductase (NADPH)
MSIDEAELPYLTTADMKVIAAQGLRKQTTAGEILYRHGDSDYHLYAIVSGEVHTVVDSGDGAERVIRRQRARQFTGELDLLTNRRAFVTNRVATAGEVIMVSRADLQKVVAANRELGDTLLSAFIERRRRLQSDAAATTRVVGSRYSSRAVELCEFLSRQFIPHEWLDPDGTADVEALLDHLGVDRSDLPLVITSGTVLRNPTPGELGAQLGLVVPDLPCRRYDLAIVGSGPAGLAAAVYAASEGLSSLCLDSFAVGGQAGMSSRIENYLGFPTGISGADLAHRAAVQAEKFGAHLSVPCRVTSIRTEGGALVLRLSDGSDVAARAVIAATGARYQRLQADGLTAFERRGVFYSATHVEARLCGPVPVIVVGGGNSAGQAAMFLAESGCSVIVVIRDDDVTKKMSRYLVDRLVAHPRIEIRTGSRVASLHAGPDGTLRSVRIDGADGNSDVPCRAVFSFIGAKPSSTWLSGDVALDEHGFVLTDRALGEDDLEASWDVIGRKPLPYETSLPGLFAVGDIRANSPKRVAAAVGEGSACVASVHAFLAHAGR